MSAIFSYFCDFEIKPEMRDVLAKMRDLTSTPLDFAPILHTHACTCTHVGEPTHTHTIQTHTHTHACTHAQGGGRVVSWPLWILEQGQWPPWISSMFWFFLWRNISRKQTRQYRKSTTTTSIIAVIYGAVNKWRHESIMDINKIDHSFGQHCLSCRQPRDLIFS